MTDSRPTHERGPWRGRVKGPADRVPGTWAAGRRRGMPRCSASASARSWRMAGRVGMDPVCQHLLCFASLAAGFPEERCHLPLLSPPHLAPPGPGGCLRCGKSSVSWAKLQPWHHCRHSTSALQEPWRLWVSPTQVRWCQRPQGGERFCFPTKFLKSEKLLLKCFNVFSLPMDFPFYKTICCGI